MDYYVTCENLAMIEGVGVHQMIILLLGNAATPRGKRPTPAASRTFHRGRGAHRTIFIVLWVDVSEATLERSFSASFSRVSGLLLFFFVVCLFWGTF